MAKRDPAGDAAGKRRPAREQRKAERTERRAHLEHTIHQLDEQMSDARAEVASSARVLRLLETGGAKVDAERRLAS